MKYNKLIAITVLVSNCLLCNIDIHAQDVIKQNNIENETLLNENNQFSLNEQINKLFNEISEEVGLDVTYIKQLYVLTGGNIVYAELQPNIYNDTTVPGVKSPMKLDGATINYREAKFIECPNKELVRPSKYYLPDAIYSISYDIASLMGQRYHYNRGNLQEYFDALDENVKKNITFYEAVLLYTGEEEDTVNKLYSAYERFVYTKETNENIVERLDDGTLEIKAKFKDILINCGITNDNTLHNLAVLLSYDKSLAKNSLINNINKSYILPYKTNYTSRENMLVAAMSLTGKVRYVWGGGHTGASNLDGINPVWMQWESLYADEPITINEDGTETKNESFGRCLKSSNSFCPIHGQIGTDFHGETVNSVDEYIELRNNICKLENLNQNKYISLLSTLDYSKGINAHTLDGLDCSGYVSWIYNQITDKYNFNSTAYKFNNHPNIEQLELGSELLPGDTFAWLEHIVMIVGKVNDGSKAYVTIEQTPNVLKFGVAYYSNAKSSDIEYAKKIAREANELIGGLNEYEEPHSYCMSTVGFAYIEKEIETESTNTEQLNGVGIEQAENTEQVNEENIIENTENNNEIAEETPTEKVLEQTATIGRMKGNFLDENTIINNEGELLKDMCAVNIIQHTLTKLPLSYVTGYNRYEGELFNKDLISSNIGINIKQ